MSEHAAPGWFDAALAQRPEDRDVRVKGCDVHYLRWGDVERPGLVLVHGGAAHAHWWSFIAPQFTQQYHVLAPDLSGHGDSGRRPVYAVETWADEIMACVADAAWTWKFDPKVFQRHRQGIDDYLADTRCRIAVFKGQYSDLVTADVQDYMNELLGRNSPIVEIPEAHHHVPLDQPLALVAALRTLLADWEHSVPKHRPKAGGRLHPTAAPAGG